MKTSLWLPSSSALLLIFSSCTNQNAGNDPLGTGPYDAQGNYHEEWADDPSKWRKPGKRTPLPTYEVPQIAKNDQPPPNSNPLGTTVSTTTKKLPAAQVESAPRETTHHSTEAVEVASREKPASTSRTRKSTTKPHVDADEPKHTVKSDEPKPKRTVSKAKSKPKPKSTRYTVKKGDTLSGIASRNSSSVSAIQKANGISGTLIRPGQSLSVPKR